MWPELVGDDADDLVGDLGLRESARMHVDAAPVDHEGVEGLIVDDAHRHAPAAEAGRLEDRLRVVVEEVLDLGVANERQALRQRSRDALKCSHGERHQRGPESPRRPLGHCPEFARHFHRVKELVVRAPTGTVKGEPRGVNATRPR